MPPKSVAAMRFVSTKTLNEFVPTEFQMRRWGGSIDFVYVYQESKEQKTADEDSILEHIGTTELTNHNNNSIFQTTPKKVRFVLGRLKRKVNIFNLKITLSGVD